MKRIRNPMVLLLGIQIGAAPVESSVEFPQKIKNGTALWPSDPTTGNISEETWNTNSKDYMHPYVYCSIICNSQDLEAAYVPISRWVDKKAVIHLHNEILLSREKEGNLTLCNSMDGLGKHCAKWNKPVRERQVPYDFTYMWNLMNKIN